MAKEGVMSRDKWIIDWAPPAAISLVAAGLFFYAIALLLAIFFSKEKDGLGDRLKAWFTAAQAQNLGIPCSAISAFAIRLSFLRRSRLRRMQTAYSI
jgi:hypothetical protein